MTPAYETSETSNQGGHGRLGRPPSCMSRGAIMLNRRLLTPLLAMFSSLAIAEQVTCVTQGSEQFRFKTVTWDTVSGRAKGTDRLGTTFVGNVTAIRKHDTGVKVNIDASYEHRLLGPMQVEIAVFPVDSGYRVMAVGYVTHEGRRLLDTNFGNQSAMCKAEVQASGTEDGTAAQLVFRSPLHKFSIAYPAAWRSLPKLNDRMVLHVGGQLATHTASMNVIVTEDKSFRLMTSQDYLARVKQSDFLQVASMSMSDLKVHRWETKYEIGKQPALMFIYSGTLNGQRQATLTTQTIRNGRLYTVAFNAQADEFPAIYAELVQILDSFHFN